MASTILTGDITVNWLDENRQKLMEWTGSATGTATMNQVYSAMLSLQDESGQGDDATAMTAETPVEYTIGTIDVNDIEPFYIQYECLQHLTGGALRTAGWTRATGTLPGIVVVSVTSNTILTTDVGETISHADADTGTLLEVIEKGATDYLVIRPATSAAANNFDSTSGVLTCNTRTATQAAASTTGEQVWANMFNVTPVEADTHAYMYQGLVSDASRARVADINDATQDWWAEGAFDRCIYIRDFTAAGNPIIDAGNITTFARKGNTLYSSFEVGTSTISGGRNPVPLSASADSNHTTGYKSITLGGASGALATTAAVGDEISGDVSGARGIVTLVTSPGATSVVHYYLIGDPQTDFNGSEAITDEDATGAATSSGAPADQGPALAAWFTSGVEPTVTFGNVQADVADDSTLEGYGYTIDGNTNPVTEIYEWLQHQCRNGASPASATTDGIEGEQYVGPSVYLEYSGAVGGGTIAEGDDVIQATSLASGIVVSHDTALKQILLRDVRGTFTTATAVTSQDAGAGNITPDVFATTFDAKFATPFGSLAGGRFFGARGGLLTDVIGADENNYQLIASDGNTFARPIAISLSVSNTVGGAQTETDSDYVVSHRLTGLAGTINKAEYSATGGEAIGDSTLVIDTGGGITADTPGKTTGGVLNINDFSDNNAHYKLRYASWTGSTFTLATTTIVAADAATTTSIQETGAFATTLRGDLVVNITRGLTSYVTEVTDANNVVIFPAITGQTTGDNIVMNGVPIVTATLDAVYVSLIDEFATSTSATVSLVYVAPIFYRVKVSNTRAATPIKRFVTDDTTSGTDRNVATIRNPDTIIN